MHNSFRNEHGESELEDCITRLKNMFTEILGPDKNVFTLGRIDLYKPKKYYSVGLFFI